MTFAQIQADAEAHLANVRATDAPALAAQVEKLTQLVCVLASELAARETGGNIGTSEPKAPRADRKRKSRG